MYTHKKKVRRHTGLHARTTPDSYDFNPAALYRVPKFGQLLVYFKFPPSYFTPSLSLNMKIIAITLPLIELHYYQAFILSVQDDSIKM